MSSCVFYGYMMNQQVTYGTVVEQEVLNQILNASGNVLSTSCCNQPIILLYPILILQ